MKEEPKINFSDKEFSDAFPASRVEEEIKKSHEWENFFSQNQGALEMENLTKEVKDDLKKMRSMLLVVLNFLDSNLKSGSIPGDTTFNSLFKVFGDRAIKLSQSNKKYLSVSDKELIYIFIVLTELKAEGFSENAVIEQIIQNLDAKYKAIQNLN